MKEIYLPNLGNAKKVGIAAVHVSPGERVSADQLVVTAIRGVPPPIGEPAAGHASPAGSAGAAEAERQRIESLIRYYQGRNEGEWAALPESGDVPATPRQIDQRGLAVSTGLLAAPIAGLLVGLGIVPMAVAAPPGTDHGFSPSQNTVRLRRMQSNKKVHYWRRFVPRLERTAERQISAQKL